MGRLIHAASGYAYDNTGSDVIPAGDIVFNGALFGVAATAIQPGCKGWIATVGTYQLPAASADVVTLGAVAYYDSTNNVVTSAAGSGNSNTKIGYFIEPKSAGETVATVLVK